MAEPSTPPARQSEIYLAGVRGVRPTVPVDAEQLERAARRALSAEAFAYLAGGAGGESTMRANRAAFERWRIVSGSKQKRLPSARIEIRGSSPKSANWPKT